MPIYLQGKYLPKSVSFPRSTLVVPNEIPNPSNNIFQKDPIVSGTVVSNSGSTNYLQNPQSFSVSKKFGITGIRRNSLT